MAAKTVWIGPWEVGGLAGISAVTNVALFKSLPQIDVYGLFYGTLLQSGAQRFSLPKRYSDTIARPLLRHRVKTYDEAEYVRVEEMLSQVLPRGEYRVKEGDLYATSDIEDLRRYLEAMLVSAHRHESCVSLFPPPGDVMALSELSIETRMALSCLFAEFVTERATAVVPRLVGDSSSVDRFEEVLSSKLFDNYASSHGALEDARHGQTYALTRLEASATALRRRYSGLLASNTLAMGLVTVTAKVVDLFCGKLGGALAEFAAKVFESMVSERRRLVVYQLHGLTEAVTKARFEDGRAIDLLRRTPR